MNASSQSDGGSRRYGCELCGAALARELYTATDRLRNSDQVFSVAACGGCGVLRTLPEMTEEELSRFYPADYWGLDDEPGEDWVRLSQREKVKFVRRCGLEGGRILDVGCGSGLFLRALGPDGWERFGVETGKRAMEVAGRCLGRDRVFSGDLIRAAFPASTFDVVTFWSALEHTNEPRASLVEARRIVKSGGSLIIQVPNAASYQAKLFRGDWFALDAPRHRYHFTPETLARLLEETGFEFYRSTFFSEAHNAHALRQSLKATLRTAKSRRGLALFILAAPLIRPVDWLMTVVDGGATLTLAARAV